jgi:DNA processing protein
LFRRTASNSDDRSCNETSDRASEDPFAFLVPNHSDDAHRTRLRSWLQLQATLAFEPEHAIACLRRTANPVDALKICGRSRVLSNAGLEIAERQLAERGFGAMPITSPLYPAPLAAISDAPPVLLVAGEPRQLSGPLVAIVGARAATVYGLSLAYALGARLAQVGVTVVSGLARGIDAAAHRGALEAGGQTIAVQACGPDRVYPAEHRGLAEQVKQNGALITELPVGTPPRAPNFPLRNRIISGLCTCIVVVEARERSGSLITARHALDQGRDVMAFPGAVTSPTSLGPNRLIRDGAIPILDVDDVIENLGIEVESSDVTAPQALEGNGTHRSARLPAAGSAAPELGKGGKMILESLDAGPVSRDELGRRVGIDPRQLDLDLMDLELHGRVVRDRDGRMTKVPLRTRSSRRGAK